MNINSDNFQGEIKSKDPIWIDAAPSETIVLMLGINKVVINYGKTENGGGWRIRCNTNIKVEQEKPNENNTIIQ